MRLSRSRVPAVAALLALVTLCVGGCFERTRPSVEAQARPVMAIRVVLAPDETWRAFDGVIRARREADLGFRTAGRIVSREVDLGSRVTEGQVLARLDPADLGLAVRAAEADLASARSQASQAAADAGRSRALVAQGWVAASADEVKQTASVAAAQRVASTQAALALARNKLDDALLRAPHAGLVTALLADPGTVVAEGQAVLRLAEQDAPEVEIALPEAALALAPSPAARVTFWAHPGLRLAARLRELSPAADRGLRTYVAHYTIADPPDGMMQGMTATVHLPEGGDGVPVAALPASALADRGQGAMVWVVPPEGGTPQPRSVAVRRMTGESVVVTGLQDGELVVTLGAQKLDPATRVRVADIAPATE